MKNIYPQLFGVVPYNKFMYKPLVGERLSTIFQQSYQQLIG